MDEFNNCIINVPVFKNNDMVIRISKGKHSWSNGGPDVDSTGIVRGFLQRGDTKTLAVEWDDYDGHSCGGLIKSDRGYYVYYDEVILLDKYDPIDILDILGG